MKTLSIDIETFSSCSLQKSGVYRYVEAPDFEILLFGYSVDAGPVKVIDLACGEKIPDDVLDALTDETVIQCAGDTGRPDILGFFIQFREIEIRHEERTQHDHAASIRSFLLRGQFFDCAGQRPGLFGREPEAQVSTPFPFSIRRAEQQGYTDVRPEVEPVHAPEVRAWKIAYFPVDYPICKRKADDPPQHPIAQAAIEIGVHLQPVM